MRRKLVVRIRDRGLDIIDGKLGVKNKDVRDVKSFEYESGIVSDGRILNPIAIKGIIENFLGKCPLKFTYEIAFIINSSEIVTKSIQIPKIKKKHFRGVIINRIDELFPNNSEFKVDYRVQGENESGIDVTVIFIPKDLYNGYFDVWKSVGINNGILDVDYNVMTLFIQGDGKINDHTLKKGRYLLVQINTFNGCIIQTNGGAVENYRNIHEINGYENLNQKIIEILYFGIEDLEDEDITIIISGENKEKLRKSISEGLSRSVITADKISFCEREIEENEIKGFIDGFTAVYSKRAKKDKRINFFLKSKKNNDSGSKLKIFGVVIILMFFISWRVSIEGDMKREKNLIENLKKKHIKVYREESTTGETRDDVATLNRVIRPDEKDIKALILRIRNYGDIHEISFRDNEYIVKGSGGEISIIGELLKDIKDGGYKRSRLVELNKDLNEDWKFCMEIKR